MEEKTDGFLKQEGGKIPEETFEKSLVDALLLKTRIPPPSPCYVLAYNVCEKIRYVIYEGRFLLIFSDKEKADEFIKKRKFQGYVPKKFDWYSLVEEFKNNISEVMLDFDNHGKGCRTIALRKKPEG